MRQNCWASPFLKYLQYVWAVLFLCSLALLYDELSTSDQQAIQLQSDLHPAPGYLQEEYDPALARLHSVAALLTYVDSVQQDHPAVAYPSLLNWTIRRRFYHGFSYYGPGNNVLASLIARFLHTDWHAIVLPDDILQHPNAGCSQQCIVLMTALRQRGFSVRNVGFYEPKQGGHYASEVYYAGSWHYYDPDFEPDEQLLSQAGKPSIKALSTNTALLRQAYLPHMTSERIDALFKTYQIGTINPILAPRARLFQLITKGYVYTGWLLLLLISWFWSRHMKGRITTRRAPSGQWVRRRARQAVDASLQVA